MSKEAQTSIDETPDATPDLARRSLGLGVLGLLGSGLAGLAARPADAFPPSAGGEFNAATRVLSRYGVKVSGDSSEGHDVLAFDMQPLVNTEYRQIIPCIKTSVLNDTAVFTHTHPGEIIPCVRTTIEGHDLATTELFDAEQGGVTPCWRMEAQMLDGGHIGDIVATHFHPASSGELTPCYKTTIHGHERATTELFDAANVDSSSLPAMTLSSQMLDGARIGAVVLDVRNTSADLAIKVGGNTYRLVDGELVKQGGAVLAGA